MKKSLLFLLLCIAMAFHGRAQSLTVTSLNPNPSEVDNDFTVNFNYTTANANDIVYLGLELKNSDGSWAATIAEKIVNPIGTSGTDMPSSAVVTVPPGVTPSADLTGGQYYELKAELNAEGWAGWLAGDYHSVNLVASGTLNTNTKNFQEKLVLYPNPVTNILRFKHSDNIKVKSLKITNLVGKTVYFNTKKSLQNAIDVSNLSSGLYILSVNLEGSIEQYKFCKK